MKVLVIGGSGTIGEAVVQALRGAGHEVLSAVRSSGDLRVEAAARGSRWSS